MRGTLRRLEAHEPGMRRIVARAGAANDRLELVQADLLEDQGWEQAAQGCAYVLHVASPVGTDVPRRQAERLIRPALDGTLRVMKADVAARRRARWKTASLRPLKA